MKVAAVQFRSSGDISENLLSCKRLIEEAATAGARLIVLPEAASQSFDSGRLDTQAEQLDGHFASQLQELALSFGVTVVAGMFRPADSIGKINRVFNTALVTGPGVHVGYDKIHTYDAFEYKESATVKPGEELVTFEVDGATVGVATCYDVRFPTQFQELARRGAQIIALPFSWEDGPDKLEQWRLLSTARALDSTSFIVAAGQARPEGPTSGPTGVGHSVVVSPTGKRLAEAGYEPGIIYADIDVDEVAKVRRVLPVIATGGGAPTQ